MPDEAAAADSEYVVEAVLDSRPAGSTVEYLVKWVGYGTDENTWEPEAHLDGCAKLDEFKQARQIKPSKRAKMEAPSPPLFLQVGDLVDIDRRYARDGGPAKIVKLLAESLKVKYLCGGHETVELRSVRSVPESAASARRGATSTPGTLPLTQKRKQPQKQLATASAAEVGPIESKMQPGDVVLSLKQQKPAAGAGIGAVNAHKQQHAEGPAEEEQSEVVVTVTEGREKRMRKSTTVNVDGQAVLKLNNYTLEDGEPTLSAGQADGPTKPKGATSAFMLFTKDARAAVADLPFSDRQVRLGELWHDATPAIRAKYDKMADNDRARFVKQTAAYEVARKEYAAAVAAAREQAAKTEWEALQAEDARRVALVAERAAKKAAGANMPAKERKLSELQRALQESNTSMKIGFDSAMQARSAFIMQHANALRHFVLPSILEKESRKPALPGPVQAAVTKTPEWIQGEMREYQLEGLTWLLQQHNHGVGAILGDEMGLGKTLQTIAFLSSLKHMKGLGGPFLVVCPMSVLSSWMTEFRRWCPSFRTIKLHSADATERDRLRSTILPDVGSYDVIVTTYEMVKSDKFNNSLKRIHFRYLVIDEGHIVKNELTLISQTLRKLHFSTALLLTGTPLQNNMHEL